MNTSDTNCAILRGSVQSSFSWFRSNLGLYRCMAHSQPTCYCCGRRYSRNRNTCSPHQNTLRETLNNQVLAGFKYNIDAARPWTQLRVTALWSRREFSLTWPTPSNSFSSYFRTWSWVSIVIAVQSSNGRIRFFLVIGNPTLVSCIHFRSRFQKFSYFRVSGMKQ